MPRIGSTSNTSFSVCLSPCVSAVLGRVPSCAGSGSVGLGPSNDQVYVASTLVEFVTSTVSCLSTSFIVHPKSNVARLKERFGKATSPTRSITSLCGWS